MGNSEFINLEKGGTATKHLDVRGMNWALELSFQKPHRFPSGIQHPVIS